MANVFYDEESDELIIDTMHFVPAEVTEGCMGCVFSYGELEDMCLRAAGRWCDTATRNIIWVKKSPTPVDISYTTVTKYLALDGAEFDTKLEVEQYIAKQQFFNATGGLHHDKVQWVIQHRAAILELLKKFE